MACILLIVHDSSYVPSFVVSARFLWWCLRLATCCFFILRFLILLCRLLNVLLLLDIATVILGILCITVVCMPLCNVIVCRVVVFRLLEFMLFRSNIMRLRWCFRFAIVSWLFCLRLCIALFFASLLSNIIVWSSLWRSQIVSRCPHPRSVDCLLFCSSSYASSAVMVFACLSP